LPTYPFAQEHYWIPVETEPRMANATSKIVQEGNDPLKTGLEDQQLAVTTPEEGPLGVSERLQERASTYFKKQLAAVSKVSTQLIEATAPLEDYGFDSMMAMRFIKVLENSFGPLPKTLLFECSTLHSVTEYFLHRHLEQLRSVLGIVEAP